MRWDFQNNVPNWFSKLIWNVNRLTVSKFLQPFLAEFCLRHDWKAFIMIQICNSFLVLLLASWDGVCCAMSYFTRNSKNNMYFGLNIFFIKDRRRVSRWKNGQKSEVGQGGQYLNFCLLVIKIFPKVRLNLCKFFWVHCSAILFVFKLLAQSIHHARLLSQPSFTHC